MSEISGKILFVDDEANVLAALVRQLRKRFDIATAHGGRAGLDAIHRDGPFAVVVSDYSMPEMNGVEFLTEVRKLAPDVVSVMLTGFAQLEVVVAALHAGQIFRFLAKPWSSDTLEATLNDCLERYRLNVEQKPLARMSQEAQREVLRDARMDRTTQLSNRATFDDYLQSLQEREGASRARYAIVLADIDNFKKFNDCYGHSAGDEALRRVAHAMRTTLRPQDFIARYGGEEIVVICENVDDDVAMRVGERLRASVYEMNAPHRDNADFGRLTISIGVACCRAQSPETPRATFARADQALYAAKRNGRNRVELATQSPAVAEPQHADVESV